MVAFPGQSHQILQPVLLQLLHCVLSGQEVSFAIPSLYSTCLSDLCSYFVPVFDSFSTGNVVQCTALYNSVAAPCTRTTTGSNIIAKKIPTLNAMN